MNSFVEPEEDAVSFDNLADLVARTKRRRPALGELLGGIARGIGYGVQGQMVPAAEYDKYLRPDDSQDLLTKLLLQARVKEMVTPKTKEQQAFEAISKGGTLPGFTPEQTQKAAGVYIEPKTESVAEKKFKLEEERYGNVENKKAEYIKEITQDTLDTIKKVKEGINYFGLFGDIPSIPGSDRFTWQSNVNKLLKRKILDVMNEMKQASRTGATGFGALNIKELETLQDASTALKRSTSPEEAARILDDMERKLNKIIAPQGPQQPPQGQQGGGQFTQEAGITEEDIQYTMQKYGVSREEVLKKIQGR